MLKNDANCWKIPGHERVFLSADSIVDPEPGDNALYPIELLNCQTPSGMPPHKLVLKVGATIMLLRNLNRSQGMCNGTRLQIASLQRNIITAVHTTVTIDTK